MVAVSFFEFDYYTYHIYNYITTYIKTEELLFSIEIRTIERKRLNETEDFLTELDSEGNFFSVIASLFNR